MHRTIHEVISEIQEAFKGVRLDDGIGLFEGRAHDDYEDNATCQACRSKDERYYWDEIPRERLEKYNDAISFFDPKGMRFHLPAFMIAELEGAQVSCIFHLIEMGNLTKQKYEDWRFGRVSCLERVVEGNLSKCNRILRIIGFHAHDLKMKPSKTVYKNWGKGKSRLLWFTRGRVPNIEEAYSRCFVWNRKKAYLEWKEESAKMVDEA